MGKKPNPAVLAEEDIKVVKPWRLPYWTQTPDWTSERIHLDLQRKSRVRVIRPQPALPAPEQPSVEEPEALPEVLEEQVDLSFPTAEELENIRRDAYNAGLEQGLIEGRQKGQQEGQQEGFAQGQAEGLAQGTEQGLKDGTKLGREQGLNQGQAQIDEQVARLQSLATQLQSRIQQRDQDLPEVLVQLIGGICRTVVGQELAQGAQSILKFVDQALQQLPEGEENVQIFISEPDSEIMQQSLKQAGRKLAWQTDASLQAGECRVHSANSLVHYQSQEHLEALLDEAQMQLRHQLVTTPWTLSPEAEQSPNTQLSSPATEPEVSDLSANDESTDESADENDDPTPLIEQSTEQAGDDDLTE